MANPKLTLYENVNFGGRSLDVNNNGTLPSGALFRGASSARIFTKEWVSFGVPGNETPRLFVHGPQKIPNLHKITKHNSGPGGIFNGHWGDEIEEVYFGAAPVREWVGKRDTVYPYACFNRDADFKNVLFGVNCYYIGVYRADHKDLPNDTISSVIVPEGLVVHMWEHEGPLGQHKGKGMYRKYLAGKHNIDAAFNDKCSFINVAPDLSYKP